MNLDAVKNYKVLVVGDAIYDRYVFVSPLGKSIKETVISVAYEREETYEGGVVAAAAHLKTLCAQVNVLHSERGMMNTRYIESIYNRKLFTLHRPATAPALVVDDMGYYDLVIVCYFGHGTMTR